MIELYSEAFETLDHTSQIQDMEHLKSKSNLHKSISISVIIFSLLGNSWVGQSED